MKIKQGRSSHCRLRESRTFSGSSSENLISKQRLSFRVAAGHDFESLRNAVGMNFFHVTEHTSARFAFGEVRSELLPFFSGNLPRSGDYAQLFKLFVA